MDGLFVCYCGCITCRASGLSCLFLKKKGDTVGTDGTARRPRGERRGSGLDFFFFRGRWNASSGAHHTDRDLSPVPPPPYPSCPPAATEHSILQGTPPLGRRAKVLVLSRPNQPPSGSGSRKGACQKPSREHTPISFLGEDHVAERGEHPR